MSPTDQAALSTAILRTVSYYDTFDYPLTVGELWRWLYPASNAVVGAWTRDDVEREVQQLGQTKRLERQGAYLFFAGRKDIVETRTTRMMANVRLWRRAESTARFLELVPFVKMVAVVNTLALDNARPDSDIDLLIITAPRHIWIARQLVTGIVALLGYRRHGKNVAGRVCLSFYATMDGLNFESLRSANPDTHFAFWTAQAVPLIDDGTYEKYRQANGWVMKLLPNAWSWEWKTKLLPPNSGLRSIRTFFEVFFTTPIGAWFESWARSYQLKRMDSNVMSKSKLGNTEVVISEDVLKFHEMDRRREYNERWRRRMSELGISE